MSTKKPGYQCYFKCVTYGVLHRFPNPRQNERFNLWLKVLNSDVQKRNPQYIYHNLRLCDNHFNLCYHTHNNKLTRNAIPTINIVSLEFKHKVLHAQSDLTMDLAVSNVSKSMAQLLNANQINKCEICLQNYEDTNYINSEMVFKEVIEKIYTCYKIAVIPGECLSVGICSNCIEALNIAYDFRLKCLTFEKRLSILCDLYVNKRVENSKIKIETDSLHSIEDNYVPNDMTGDSNDIEVKLEDYKCSICNKILKSKESLLRHNISMHQKRKHLGKITGCGESRRYHCTKCSYYTPHSQTLVNHMRRHNGERPYHCECGKNFTQSSSLAAHRKTHSSTTYYTCSICGKQFKHAFTLKKHLRVHEPGKYFCDICHKSLKSAQSLQDHKHRHYNIKNYNCEDCGDTFVTCSELLNHKKKHTSVKEIGCQLCSYKTHTKKNLVIHLKRHTGDKSIKCGLCELTFYTSGDLRRHHRVHTREKPFACPTCAQRFTHSTSLNKHIHNVHGLEYKWEDFKFKELKRNKNLQVKIPISTG